MHASNRHSSVACLALFSVLGTQRGTKRTAFWSCRGPGSIPREAAAAPPSCSTERPGPWLPTGARVRPGFPGPGAAPEADIALLSACRGDWLLSFVYRTSSVQLRVAGLQPVLLQDRRVENVDLSSVVSIACPAEGSAFARRGAS